MAVTPNSNGTKCEKICALLFEINGGTGNCTMNGYEIEKHFKVKSIQPLPSEKEAVTPKKNDSEPTEQPDADSNMTLIAVLASCGALALILIAFAVYCSYHRLSYRKNQQHLTEELQTVENGYHDNPTLEVMEVQPEVQEKKLPLEKKLVLNGEFNDSWIVPFDNLGKDDIPDEEEDTHL
ncbi:podocalyxin [Clarias gariepinus]|uniref:podocalyxin n=1 Tax=Clarias gariepinus TaxID=13013 RepID=UPI00234D5BB8|nr:podocalyxin [Clarias gariepinus]